MTGLQPQFDIPDFECDGIDGKGELFKFELSKFSGSFVLFLFFPCDPLSTDLEEMEEFSSKFDEFQSKNCAVIGIAVETRQNVIEWFNTVNRRFPILIDTSMNISKSLCAINRRNSGILRSQVLVDYRGIVRHTATVDKTVERKAKSALKILDCVQRVDAVAGIYY